MLGGNQRIVLAVMLLMALALSLPCGATCGDDSARALLSTFSKENRHIDAGSTTLLDVKKLCEEDGLQVEAVKGKLEEIISLGLPAVVNLKSPAHFLVIMDATSETVRVLDGDPSEIRVLPRVEIESRFTGYALIPNLTIPPDAPNLKTPHTDEYQTFTGVGQKVDYHFPLKNTGKTALSVEVVSTSCGCTAAVIKGADPKHMTLAPGAESEVVVSYQVQTQAPIQQTATLKTNDPRHPVVYLSIRGQLPPQLTLSPPALYVDQNLGEEPNKAFKVIGPKGTRIEKVWSDLPYLQLRRGDEGVDGERVKWPVAVNGFAQAPVGPISGKINIRLTNGQEMFIPVRGVIEGVLPGAAQAALLPRAEDDHETPMGSPLPTLKVGEVAPDFRVVDANGKPWHLSALRGQKNVLLTFFPKCFTGGCATQLSSLRDHQSDFDTAQTQILAVSVDPARGDKGQLAFAKQWGFQFPLIPDAKRVLGKQFGAIQNDDERAARLSFLIDKQGVVRWIDTDVHVSTHGADMLAKIKELGLDR